MATIDRYRSVVDTLGLAMPTWVPELSDATRIAAYDGYTDMYDNVPATFATAMRGSNDKPLYAPGASRIVETTNRYLCRDFTWSVASLSNNANDVALIQQALATFGRREELPAKFYSLKRNFLIKGDACFHITFDLARPAGERISLNEIDPRQYFRIPSGADENATSGCYLVDLIFADDGRTQIARRLEYKKVPQGTAGGFLISTRLSFYETNAWDDRYVTSNALKPVDAPAAYKTPEFAPLLTGFMLPPIVQAVPVYHYRNKRRGSEPFGTSEVAGLETLIVGKNQALSDEDFTLALQGLGLYVTDSPRPVDDDGNTTDWIIEPGYVLELRGSATKFERVSGVTSIAPYQDHIRQINDETDQSAAIPAAAAGKVTAEVAASGVALRLEMAPIIAKNEEKETEILARSDQLFHDLVFMWFPQDGIKPADDIVVSTSCADPLPQDRTAIITEITGLVAAGLVSKDFAIKYLAAKLGFQFPADMADDIDNERDAAGERVLQELGALGDPNAAVPGAAPAPTASGAVA